MMEKKVFKASKGSMIKKEKVQAYGEFLWNFKEENGNVITPAQVIEAAKPKKSPIHDFFEWDNEVAGEKYREWQARYLLGRIEVVITVDGDEQDIKAFHNIVTVVPEDGSEGRERGYVTVADLRENPDYLDIVLEDAKKEIVFWEKRYSQYKRLRKFKELRPLFTTIKAMQINV
jgi:hypothetical protein